MNTATLPNFNEGIAAARAAAVLQYRLIFSESPADFLLGIHPIAACLRRLYETEITDLPELLACTFAPEGLKQAAIAEHPQDIAARQADLLAAVTWEMQRFGCVLLASNPYHQPQMFGGAQ